MSRDPILDELRSIREAIAREHDYDVSAIFAMFRQSAAASGRPHVDLSTSTPVGIPGAARLGDAADEPSPRR
jgi:hypothetical protein